MDTTHPPTDRAATDPDDTGDARRQRIVVGIDGSPGADVALRWAFIAAARRGADIEALAAFPVDLYWIDAFLVDRDRIEAVRSDTGTRARAMVEQVRDDLMSVGPADIAEIAVEVRVVAGGAAEQLVQRTVGADLLVVGSRGRGGVRSTVLGSVALHCAQHAECPVVVVHSLPDPASSSTVVVGLDDSDHARAALVTAVQEAGRAGARVDAVLAYEAPNYWSDLAPVMGPVQGETPVQARARGEAIVSDVLGPGPVQHGAVRVVAVQGLPGEVLVRHAQGAGLLVVGSRSRSRLRGMVLGSTALHCVVHAPCPVMVVHRRPTDRTSASPVAAVARA